MNRRRRAAPGRRTRRPRPAAPSPASPSHRSRASPLPNTTIPPWDGKERLNILLIGTDQRPKEGTYNTDTLIVVSIDPTTKQVAMFSLPRDTVDVPHAVGSAPQGVRVSVYTRKINAFFTSVRNRPDLVAGTDRTRGYNGLKLVLGNLYDLDIKYFVEVNFDGFRQVVDAMGGVTINVQIPVTDETYPSDTGRLSRVYIPAGLQHMTGAQALVYARSRHSGQGDFDRGARQQRVLTSLRAQADIGNLVPRIPELAEALKATVRTDIPQAELAKLAGPGRQRRHEEHPLVRLHPGSLRRRSTSRARGATSSCRRSTRSGPRSRTPSRSTRSSRIAARRSAEEGASVWVLNGSGRQGQASNVAAYLEYYGITASAPNQKPDAIPTATRIVVYNGAEAELAADGRIPRGAVRDDGRPGGRSGRARRHPHHDGGVDRGPRPARRACSAASVAAARPSGGLISVSQWLYSGSRPRTASK